MAVSRAFRYTVGNGNFTKRVVLSPGKDFIRLDPKNPRPPPPPAPYPGQAVHRLVIGGRKTSPLSLSKAATMPPPRLNPQLFNPALYARVHNVWFGDLAPTATVAPFATMQKWFGMAPAEEKAAFDTLCTDSFKPALDSIGPKAWVLPSWQQPPTAAAEKAQAAEIAAPFLPVCSNSQDALAIVLLLDQMSRNIFREQQGVIYTHYDRIARALLRELLLPADKPGRVDLEESMRYSVVRRSFLYMPLMHSEILEDHMWYQELMAGLSKDAESRGDAEGAKQAAGSVDFGKKHQVIIEQFGRYPHRNEWMGRDTTAEEKEYMEKGGESFGTKKKEKKDEKDEL